jgi:hypothetical protein
MNAVVSCSSNVNNSLDLNLLNDVTFDIFEAPEDVDTGDQLHELNPDVQYFNDQVCFDNTSCCKYYNSDLFNTMCAKNGILNDCFSMVCLNVRSAPKNLSEFRNYLNLFSHEFSVIGLTETWLNEENMSVCNLNGYQCEHAVRQNRMGGGVSLFLKSHINYTQRNDLQIFCQELESLFIEIPKDCLGSTKNTLVGVIYRPPGTDLENFLILLNDLLDKICHDDVNIYLMGDFNINLLNADSHLHTSHFIDTMYSKSLFPLVNKPTRMHNSTATLIDNIFTNNIFDNTLISGIFLSDISDHFPVFSIISELKIRQAKQIVKLRSFSHVNKSLFSEKLGNTDWDDVMQCLEGKSAFSVFHKRLSQLFDSCFPLQSKSTNYSNKKQWLTPGLKKSIKIKNILYIKSKRNCSSETVNKYKAYKSRLNRIMKKCEREYYNNKISRLKNNARKSWTVIKSIINKQKVSKVNDKFRVGDRIIDNGVEISDRFNRFFASVGPSLANKIPQVNKHATEYITYNTQNSIFLQNTDSNEIKSIIYSLKESSPGWDNITASCLKSNYEVLSPILAHLVNLSLTQGFFPHELKVARVVPLFKSDDPTFFTNYRPVSILSVISKIFERVMHTRLSKYINDNNILHKFQFGFREGYNTSLASVALVDKINSTVHNNEFVLQLAFFWILKKPSTLLIMKFYLIS